MRYSIIILLLVIIFILLTVINLKENFDITSSSTTNSEVNDNENVCSVSNIYRLNKDYELKLCNISSFSDHYYEKSMPQTECNIGSDCSTSINQQCLNTEEDLPNKKYCYNRINDIFFKLDLQEKTSIELAKSLRKNIQFTFKFLFTNVRHNHPLIYDKDELWSIVSNRANIYLCLWQFNKEQQKYTFNEDDEIYKIRLNNNILHSYVTYKITINSNNNILNINFDDNRSPKNINKALNGIRCSSASSDCPDEWNCNNTNYTSGKCTPSNEVIDDKYVFGRRFDEQTNINTFMNGYIGDVTILEDGELSAKQQCQFDSKPYKNNTICNKACSRLENCNQSICNDKCDNIPQCSFVTQGRHETDCINMCLQNDQCSSEFCNKQCRECEPFCPWDNEQSDVDRFDSQYYNTQGKPSPPDLFLNSVAIDGSKASINWKKPYSPEENPIKGYILYIYNTFNKSEGVKINMIKIEKDSSNNILSQQEYIIKDLIPDETYTVGLKAYNKNGLGNISNNITFKSNVSSINMDMSTNINVNDTDIGDYNYCNINDE